MIELGFYPLPCSSEYPPYYIVQAYYVQPISIEPQDRDSTPTRGKNHLGRAGRVGFRRVAPAPRHSGSAGGAHKPKEKGNTLKKRTLWSLRTLTHLAFHDGVLHPVHRLQADGTWCRSTWRCSGSGEGGGFVLIVRAGQGVEIVAHTNGVQSSHLQHLLLCINEREVDVCTLVGDLPGGFAKTQTNQKPECN